jgi:hypothetical protein
VNLVWSTGRPYGAPLLTLRGGATRDPDVKAAIKAAGFLWDGSRHAWITYTYDAEQVVTDLASPFPNVVLVAKGQADH